MNDATHADECWGVYEAACIACGRKIVIVATVHSVEHGYAEAFEQGQPTCMACIAVRKMSLN